MGVEQNEPPEVREARRFDLELQHALRGGERFLKRATGGCCGCLVVGGIVLTFFSTALGVSCATRIPASEDKVVLASTLGEKKVTGDTLESYVLQSVQGDERVKFYQRVDLFDMEYFLTFNAGYQPFAPDFEFNLRGRSIK